MEGSKMKANKIQAKQVKLRQEVKEKTIGYILAAFGLVAGLAWNEAIKALITVFFPAPTGNNDVLIKVIYAVVVTVVIVIVSVYLARLIAKKE